MAKKPATETSAPATTASVDPATIPNPPATHVAPPSAAGEQKVSKKKPDVPSGTATFELVSPLLADGEEHGIGDEIELTFRQYTELKAAGVIAGDWPAKS
jgi:hypothetical protein